MVPTCLSASAVWFRVLVSDLVVAQINPRSVHSRRLYADEARFSFPTSEGQPESGFRKERHHHTPPYLLYDETHESYHSAQPQLPLWHRSGDVRKARACIAQELSVGVFSRGSRTPARA